jgi:hypothetical protein
MARVPRALWSPLCTDSLHGVFNRHSARPLEDQGPMNPVALAQWTFEIDKHDVRAARLELHSFAGFDFNVSQVTHFCDVIFNGHCVELKHIRNLD